METRTQLRADAVLEGGGVKGIALVGAIAAAEERGYQWVNLAGTSAGAIVAALLTAGYTAAEMKTILQELDYTFFQEAGFLSKVPIVGPGFKIFFEKGVYNGKLLEQWMRDLLRKKGVNTFGDLIFDDDERYRFKLRVLASDISSGRLLCLPQDIADFGIRPEDLDVAAAVRMSVGFPLYYEPVKLRNTKTNQVSYIVDGSILSNYPVWLFDTVGNIPEWPTFGFKLVEAEEGRPRKVRGIASFLLAIFSTMMEAHDDRYIVDKDLVRTIAIPTLGVQTTEFDISRERSEVLYQAGREAAERFFNAWNFSSYIEAYRSQNGKGKTRLKPAKQKSKGKTQLEPGRQRSKGEPQPESVKQESKDETQPEPGEQYSKSETQLARSERLRLRWY